MKFSSRERKDLVFAGVMISLAFAILLSGGYSVLIEFNSSFFVIFFIAFLTAGLGFLLHEGMHKYIAQKYGLRAEFQAYYPGLWMALLFSLFGFIIAAPGAVYIYGVMSRERNGKISLAGPMTNVVLAVIFLILLALFWYSGSNSYLLKAFLEFGLTINSLLAAFNMIPAMPFDGAKVKAWSNSAYFITLVIAIGLFVLSLIL